MGHHALFDPWSQPAAAPTHLFSDEPPTKLAAKYYTKREPPRLAAFPSRRLSTAAPCPLDPPPPPHPLGLLTDHTNPAVAQFPHTDFSHLADRSLLARAIHALALRRALPLSFHHNTLLAFYFRHRCPDAALHLFDAMPDRAPSSWYTAVSGCVRCGRDANAFDLLRGMRGHEVPLSRFALASLVTSCERYRLLPMS